MEPMNEAWTILMNRTTRNTAEMYKILRKESKNLIKSKKREAVEDKIIEIVELSKENEQRCRGPEGEIITDEELTVKRQAQHSTKNALLNKNLLNEESEPNNRDE